MSVIYFIYIALSDEEERGEKTEEGRGAAQQTIHSHYICA